MNGGGRGWSADFMYLRGLSTRKFAAGGGEISGICSHSESFFVLKIVFAASRCQNFRLRRLSSRQQPISVPAQGASVMSITTISYEPYDIRLMYNVGADHSGGPYMYR